MSTRYENYSLVILSIPIGWSILSNQRLTTNKCKIMLRIIFIGSSPGWWVRILTWLMLCDDKEAETRFFAAPKADPTFSDMFMNEVEDEIELLQEQNAAISESFSRKGPIMQLNYKSWALPILTNQDMKFWALW